MSIRPPQNVDKQFPFREEFHDFAGCPRQFEITLHTVHGEIFGIIANELSRSEGYRFEVDLEVRSLAAVGSALGKLRRKIRNALVTRNLRRDTHGTKMFAGDELYGRISSDGLIVDGELLRFEEFNDLLKTHEGFEIRLRIGEL